MIFITSGELNVVLSIVSFDTVEFQLSNLIAESKLKYSFNK